MLSRWIGMGMVVAMGSGGCTGGETDGVGGNGGTGGDAPSFEACATQHVGQDGVIVCERAFDTAPFVHLPPSEGKTSYMAMRGCESFVDRSGAVYQAPALSLCANHETGAPNDEATGHAFAVYRVTLDADARVEAFERWAIIDEKNLLLPFTNVSLEGLVSKRDAEGKFELAATLPIRLATGAPKLVTTEADGTSTYEIESTVENLASGVMAADGSCMPALNAGVSAPFPGATKVVLGLSRVPSMHLSGDDQAVFDVRVDIASTPLVLGHYDGVGHGTPGYIPSFSLGLATGGGGPCALE
jgi:hypothetical protein